MFLIEELPYKPESPESIEEYAKILIDKRFRDIFNKVIEKAGNKGGLGQLLEEEFFYLKNNSDSEPDFKEAGVELKATPFKKKKSNSFCSKERLVLGIINYMEVHKEEFDNSSFIKKNALLLLVFYLYEEGVSRLDYLIKFVQLFQFPEKDLLIIRDDWNKIVKKIRIGQAHELSEGDTNFLGACTKGANKDTVRQQPFNNIKAQQRAFCLKQSYMTYVLNEYIIKGKKTYDATLIKDPNILKKQSFEDFVISKISAYAGKSIGELSTLFGVHIDPKAKNYASKVADNVILGILGVDSKKIEEFKKANIKIKTIRLENSGKLVESMSFPAFKFKEIIKEEWEESTLREMFLNTRFLFVIYQYDENQVLKLKKAMFWNIPFNDLEEDVREVWQKTVETIKSGVKVIKKSGKREFNNLPSAKENRVAHVRPHGRDKTDTYPLPMGEQFPKQCFWLNNSYILGQITKN